MRDILPRYVIQKIRDRYLAGIADAEAGFQYGEGDEDSLTGALGQAILTPEMQIIHANGKTYFWKIYYHKIRGRGPNAPEKILGADGIFEIEVIVDNISRKKGLPFQAKKGWSISHKALIKQARNMLETTKSGLIIDYTSKGYTGCPAEHVVTSRSKKELQQDKQIRHLGQILGNDFLDCTIGIQGLVYDHRIEKFIDNASPFHVIGTLVQDKEIINFPN